MPKAAGQKLKILYIMQCLMEESDESSESSERSVEPISDISVIPSVETSGEAPIPSDRLESAALAITAIVALLLIAVAIALRKSIKK